MSRNGRSDWRSVVERFKESGLSQKRFCEQEGISVSTFSYWMRKASVGPIEAESAAFVELGFVNGIRKEESQPDLVVELPLGVVLRFHGVSR